jgi:hypothetical protein
LKERRQHDDETFEPAFSSAANGTGVANPIAVAAVLPLMKMQVF